MAALTEEAKAVAERFEQAVKDWQYYMDSIERFGECDLDLEKVNAEYSAAKAELLQWLSWVP